MDHQNNFTRAGGELQLSNSGQMELLRAVVARGVPLRSTVRGFSMFPFIRDGDTLTIAPPGDAALRVGEVVAFTQPASGQLAIHRIIARAGAGWLIRGDNSWMPDGVIPPENIIGRVVCVERNRRVVRFGLGGAARGIAWLARRDWLLLAVAAWYLPRRVGGALLRRLGLYKPPCPAQTDHEKPEKNGAS
jgi:hypothetical protein